MSDRAHRKTVAEETVAILKRGHYAASGGTFCNIGPAVRNAIEGTRLYRPDDLHLSNEAVAERNGAPKFEVVNETTLAGAQSLLARSAANVCCLNFASAKNPGGGFLRGSQAQEEALARASALSVCLEATPKYYEVNRNHDTALYTDHIIYSPDVPVFRDDHERLLDVPWLTSFVSAPAPNAGAVHRNEPNRFPDVAAVLTNRAWRVLEVCRLHGHHNLVLGAWGCGVFGNEPLSVATIFRDHLLGARFSSVFDTIRFSVLDTKNDGTYDTFRAVFSDCI